MQHVERKAGRVTFEGLPTSSISSKPSGYTQLLPTAPVQVDILVANPLRLRMLVEAGRVDLSQARALRAPARDPGARTPASVAALSASPAMSSRSSGPPHLLAALHPSRFPTPLPS